MLINIDFRWLKQGIKNRNSVLNRVGKSAIFVLNRVRVMSAISLILWKLSWLVIKYIFHIQVWLLGNNNNNNTLFHPIIYKK